MEAARIHEIAVLVAASKETDNSDLEAEKTAVIGELLVEVERLSGLGTGTQEGA